MSRDVIWQPGHVTEESIKATADGLRDGRETSFGLDKSNRP